MKELICRDTRNALLYLLSIGIGSLSSITIFHLIPESLDELGPQRTITFISAGYILLLLLSWLVHRSCKNRSHYHHDEPCNHHDPLAGILVNMTASCAHSIQDGLMLGVSFVNGPATGIAALYSTVLHEIPKKLGDYSFLRPRTSLGTTIALLAITVLCTLGSVALVLLLGLRVDETPWLSALLAGGFIYYLWGHMLPDLIHRIREQKVGFLMPLLVGLAGFLGMFSIFEFIYPTH